ncbi:MAG: VOC family protein [Bacteroidota bacterium]
MIKGLYETHLFVENLERSTAFYSQVMGLKLCRLREDRRTAFFWVGEDKKFMLGLWEKPKEQIDIRHFAFECEPEWVLHESVPFLQSHGIPCWNFLDDANEKPMVFCWMPAISIYFHDPDGHELEYIGVLPGKVQSEDERRVVSYEDWLKIKDELL